MTLGPSPQKITAVLPSASCILLTESPTKGLPMSAAVVQGLPVLQLQSEGGHGPMSSASSTASSSSSSSDLVRCKRRINFMQYAIPHAQPVAVARRNARERNRVKQVNNGFSTLRQHIPFTARNKKMSKVETLKCAVEYIRSLQLMLDEHASSGEPAVSPAPSSPQHEEEAVVSEVEATKMVTGSDHGYYSSPESVLVLTGAYQFPQPELHHLQPASLSPPCSAPSEPASSPTPSFASESEASSYPTSVYEPPALPVAQQAYDNYEPMSPEDEELLDVISWWQQSQ